MFQIVQSPHEILRTPAQEVNFGGSKLQKIVQEMIETMCAQKNPEGVGLAANQVGLPWKIFVARFDSNNISRSQPGKRSSNKNISVWPVRVFVNPIIVEHSEDLQSEKDDSKSPLEGCLSKPDYYGAVKRWQWVKLKFVTFDLKQQIPNDLLNFKFQISNFDGFPATVIQHEMDHLNGKIFIERILEQNGKLYKIVGKDKNGKEKWEEVDLFQN